MIENNFAHDFQQRNGWDSFLYQKEIDENFIEL